ncbi:MAG: MYXO-CTERM sorting domain-containing protein [Myxococcota bacterium]
MHWMLRMAAVVGGGLCLSLAVAQPAEAGGGGAKLDIPAGCSGDIDCAQFPDNPWCSPGGSCGTCSDASNCADADQMCIDGACVVPCVEDMDCTAEQPTCDTQGGRCVQCQGADACADGEYCAQGYCLDDVCAEGDTICLASGAEVGTCNAEGSGYMTLEVCADGTECVASGGASSCAVVGEGTTGSATTGVDGTADGADGMGSSDSGGASGIATSGAADPDDDAEGCSCRADDPADLFTAGLLVLGLLGLRRRR